MNCNDMVIFIGFINCFNYFLSMLFSKTKVKLKKEHMISLLIEGEWETIHQMAQGLRKQAVFTVDERRKFLLLLSQEHSRLAAKILLETDQDFCLRQLDNSSVLYFCDLLGDRTSPSFLKQLLISPRSDEIWQKAAAALYDLAGEDVPKKLNL